MGTERYFIRRERTIVTNFIFLQKRRNAKSEVAKHINHTLRQRRDLDRRLIRRLPEKS